MVRLAMTDSQAKQVAKVSPLKGPMTLVDRRALLTALGGAAIATMAQPLSGHAQARQPMRRIGVLTWWSEYDPEGQSQAVALAQGLAKLGWTEGVNVKIEYRRVFGESERIDSYATQLVNHQPDLLVGVATPAVTALLRVPEKSARLSEAARELIGRRYDWAWLGDQLAEHLSALKAKR